MQSFRSLKVWQKSHSLTLGVYAATKCFPREEVYGLTSQLRRSAVSIPSNLAEGCGRGGDKDFRRFVGVAMGSASELEYQLFLACELGYVDDKVYERLVEDVEQVKRMLAALIRRLSP